MSPPPNKTTSTTPLRSSATTGAGGAEAINNNNNAGDNITLQTMTSAWLNNSATACSALDMLKHARNSCPTPRPLLTIGSAHRPLTMQGLQSIIQEVLDLVDEDDFDDMEDEENGFFFFGQQEDDASRWAQ